MNFIKLPSGNAINTEKVVWAVEIDGSTRYRLEGDLEDYSAEPGMLLETFLNLLQPKSAVITPILELRVPEVGEAVMFRWEGSNRHGVICGRDDENQKVGISSHGVHFQYDLPTGYTVEVQ